MVEKDFIQLQKKHLQLQEEHLLALKEIGRIYKKEVVLISHLEQTSSALGGMYMWLSSEYDNLPHFLLFKFNKKMNLLSKMIRILEIKLFVLSCAGRLSEEKYNER